MLTETLDFTWMESRVPGYYLAIQPLLFGRARLVETDGVNVEGFW